MKFFRTTTLKVQFLQPSAAKSLQPLAAVAAHLKWCVPRMAGSKRVVAGLRLLSQTHTTQTLHVSTEPKQLTDIFAATSLFEQITHQDPSVSATALPGPPGHESTFTCRLSRVDPRFTHFHVYTLFHFICRRARLLVVRAHAVCSYKKHLLTSSSVWDSR